jgi:PLP dependent protein
LGWGMISLEATIQNNIQQVNEQIFQAAQSAGRDTSQVRLVIVTKAQPIETVKSVIDAGAHILGENYPEESVAKITTLGRPNGLVWHMIGHLQSRKVGIVIDHFDVLQSLDSLRLAEKLQRQLIERQKEIPVMIEFNVGGEASKSGWPAWDEQRWDRLFPDMETLLAMEQLKVSGLMTMPPWNADPEQSRLYFIRLRKLADFLSRRFGAEYFRELSMGTSIDYKQAVEEGATLVRIGQAILGPRPPKG